MSTDTFQPKINNNSRRLTSGLLSVKERQEFDKARRESRYRELVEKLEKERSLTETFKPTTNRRIRYHNNNNNNNNSYSNDVNTSNKHSALVSKSKETLEEEQKEETFHPVINSNSQRIISDESIKITQDQLKEVRQRVQMLWRNNADIENNEITIGGVYNTLRELGIDSSSSSQMIDKFMQALGLNETAGIRCVSYDRFVKVFTVVLRASMHKMNNNNNNNNNSESPKRIENIKPTKSIESNASLNSYRTPSRSSVPTMRRRESYNSLNLTNRVLLESNGNLKGKIKSKTNNKNDYNNIYNNNVNSPSPTAPVVIKRSSSLNINNNNREKQQNKTKSSVYNPLEECTFAPIINKKSKRTVSTYHNNINNNNNNINENEIQTKRKNSLISSSYKTREEEEIEACTFAPNTASFHKGRDSLAWWAREPFTNNNNNNNNNNNSDNNNNNNNSDNDINSDNNNNNNNNSDNNNNNNNSDNNNNNNNNSDNDINSDNNNNNNNNNKEYKQKESRIPLTIGFDKAVQRMIDARKKSKPKFEEMLRNSNEETLKPLRPTIIEPFILKAQTRQLKRELQKPLLYIDVDLPSGKTGRIGVHKGDNATDLARDFSQMYGLSEILCEKLEMVLTEKLKELLSENVRTLWL